MGIVKDEFQIHRDAWESNVLHGGSNDIRYIGVDMNIDAIEFAKSEITDQRASFHNFAIVEDGYKKDTIENNGWSCGYARKSGKPANESYVTRAISLKKLFELTEFPDLLILDIENMEYRVLSTYDWKHKPRYIKVEMHTLENSDRLIQLIMSNGYVLLNYSHTNYGLTSDASFLRNDLVNREKERFGYI